MNNRSHRSFLSRILYSPDERRLRAGWRLALHYSLIFILLIIASIPLVFVISPQELISSERGQVLNGLVSIFAFTGSVYIARRWLDQRSLISLGLEWDGKAWRELIFGVVINGLMIGLVFAIEWALGWLQFEAFAWQTQPVSSVVRGTALMLVTFIMIGWGEELLSRGYWLQNLKDGLNMKWAVPLSSAAFALLHWTNPNYSWRASGGLFLAGLILAYGYVRTDRLWLPIGMHIGWNFFEGTVFGFTVSGTQSFHLIEHNVVGPEIWTGGAFGPEAGLVQLPALVLGVLLIWLYTKK
ncbi:MAG: type II CAAX endopeptidase family protein [Anaerolineales bacterium]|jgi:membrane protease YdiL (CAAX protease family)